MQKVTLDELKKLAKKVNESNEDDDLGGLSFKTIEQLVQRAFDSNENAGSKDLQINQAYMFMKRYIGQRFLSGALKIKLVGTGSSRAAFACEGGKCLKLAFNQKGLAQNKQEAKNTMVDEPCIAFAQTYAIDKKYGFAMLTECCAELNTVQFRHKFGITWYDFIDFLEDFADEFLYSQKQAKISSQELDKFIDEESERKWLPQHLVYRWMKEGTAVGKTMKALLQFFCEHLNDDLMFQDLLGSVNWGLGIRFGEIVPLVLDTGFSKEVQKNYY